MPLPSPSVEDLQELARQFHFTLTNSEAEQYLPHVLTSLDSYAALDDLREASAQVAHPRERGHAPTEEDNPVNGWAWRCSIKERTDGPLAGCKVGIKDNTAVAGLPLRLGTTVMGDFVADRDATVVSRLLSAGAEIIGKTAVPAFCFDGGGFVGGFEPAVLNPADPTRVPGGSSSGSAAVVVNGDADMALGGDQGGSIRLPASFSGCCGHKPTYGLVPYTGIFPVERTLDHAGPLARTVEECALMLDAIAGPDGLDPRQPPVSVTPSLPRLDDGVDGLRVGLVAEGFGIEGTSEAEVDEAVRSTAHALRGFGAEVKDTSVSMHRDGLNIWNAIVVQGCADLVFRGDGVGTNASGDNSTGLSDYFARVERELADHFPPTVKLTLLVAAHVTRQAHHHYYTQAQNLSRALRAAYDTALQEFDVLMLPTTAMRAFKRPPADAPLAAIFSAALGNLHNVVSVNVTGHPALSVPVPHNSGPPIGCQIIGRLFDDATVLRVGKAVQAV